jgi:hypothetical protein
VSLNSGRCKIIHIFTCPVALWGLSSVEGTSTSFREERIASLRVCMCVDGTRIIRSVKNELRVYRDGGEHAFDPVTRSQKPGILNRKPSLWGLSSVEGTLTSFREGRIASLRVCMCVNGTQIEDQR